MLRLGKRSDGEASDEAALPLPTPLASSEDSLEFLDYLLSRYPQLAYPVGIEDDGQLSDIDGELYFPSDDGLLDFEDGAGDLQQRFRYRRSEADGSSELSDEGVDKRQDEQNNGAFTDDGQEAVYGDNAGLEKRPMNMLRLGKRPMNMLRLGKRQLGMLRLGKRPMNMLRLGKRPMNMLRLGKRPMNMLRLGKRPMNMLRLGKRPMNMLRLGKRPMNMLRLGKRPMNMLRLGKRPMSMLRLGKRPMSMLRLGKRPMQMLRLGKRPRMGMLRLGKRAAENEEPAQDSASA